MNKRTEMEVKTAISLSLMLEEHKSEWQNYQPMVDAKTKLDLFLQQSEILRKVAGEKTEGVTLVKNNLKKGLLKDIRLLRNALIVYADIDGNASLLKQVEMQSKRMNKFKKEIQLFDSCNFIYDLANTHKAELTDFKVSQAMLDDTQKLLNKFKNSIATPVMLIRCEKAGRTELEKLHRSLKLLLINRLDKMVNLMEADSPDFAAKYFAMRPSIKTRGKGKNQDNSSEGENAS